MSDEIIDREIKYEPNLEGTGYRNFGVQVIPPSEKYRENYDRIFRKPEMINGGSKVGKTISVSDPYSDKERLAIK